MPTYAYRCDRCGHSYEEFKGINDPFPAVCPHCGEPWGEVFHQNYAASRVIGVVYGNPTTFGQQAEINAKRVGKEQMAKMAEEAKVHNRRAKKAMLPPGAKPVETKAETPWWRDGTIPGIPKLDQPLDVTKIKNVKDYVEGSTDGFSAT